MNNFGMGQNFNPHTLRGKTVKEIAKKYEEEKWYDEEKEKKDNQSAKKFNEER